VDKFQIEYTALILAAEAGHTSIVETLCEYGEDKFGGKNRNIKHIELTNKVREDS
jgi:ankyrin repeat protein